jgi:hypothetical protein
MGKKRSNFLACAGVHSEKPNSDKKAFFYFNAFLNDFYYLGQRKEFVGFFNYFYAH